MSDFNFTNEQHESYFYDEDQTEALDHELNLNSVNVGSRGLVALGEKMTEVKESLNRNKHSSRFLCATYNEYNRRDGIVMHKPITVEAFAEALQNFIDEDIYLIDELAFNMIDALNERILEDIKFYVCDEDGAEVIYDYEVGKEIKNRLITALQVIFAEHYITQQQFNEMLKGINAFMSDFVI